MDSSASRGHRWRRFATVAVGALVYRFAVLKRA